MQRLRLSCLAVLLASFGALAGPPDAAAAQPNVIVMGMDHGTVHRFNRVYGRVASAIVAQLQQTGFTVFDETHVALAEFSPDGDDRLSDAAVLDAARLVESPPLDLVVLFRIYPQSQALRHTRELSARVEGRLLSVHSGQRLGSFEAATPRPLPVALRCDHDCQLEHLGDEARILAQHVGAVLAAQLDALAPAAAEAQATEPKSLGQAGLAQHYELNFNNFSDTDIADIEELLVAFSGYRLHRPVRCQPRYCKYWYESTTDSARLRRNLQMMLMHLGISGTVAFSGNTAMVEKIVLPTRRP